MRKTGDRSVSGDAAGGRSSPSFEGKEPASKRASAAARGSSKKRGTRCELVLRRALWASGLRYRLKTDDLPGKPDLVFRGARVAIFCDGDFWHGKDWPERKRKLEKGHNAPYWVAKIERNMARDRARELELVRAGWTVVRVWESEIHRQLERVVREIREVLGRGERSRPEAARHILDNPQPSRHDEARERPGSRQT